MKKYIILLLTAVMAVSCDSYLDKHQQYLEGGETVYLQKIDSIVACPGNERALFKMWYSNGNKLSNTIIYWNNRADSLVHDLSSLRPGRDSLAVSQNFSEGNYNIEIVNVNDFGQRSLATTCFVSVYGQEYQSSLSNRALNKATLVNKGNGFRVEWYAASENCVKQEIKYLELNGDEKTVTVEGNDVTIDDLPVDNKFVYRTFYRPEELSVDLFPSSWSDPIELPLYEIEVTGLKGLPAEYNESFSGNVSLLWDGDTQSNAGGLVPWCASMDLGTKTKVSRVRIHQYGWYTGWTSGWPQHWYYGSEIGGNVRTFEIYGTNDLSTWKLMATCKIAVPSGSPETAILESDYVQAKNGHDFKMPTDVEPCRYLRIRAVDGFNGHGAGDMLYASELLIWGDDRFN